MKMYPLTIDPGAAFTLRNVAVQWLHQNPNDPNAKQVREALAHLGAAFDAAKAPDLKHEAE